MQNFLTNKQLDYQCLKKALCSDDDIDALVRQPLFNTVLYEAYSTLDAVNHPFYDKSTTLTVAADQEELSDTTNNGGIITALNATAHTITRSTGAFVAGSIVAITETILSTGVISSIAVGIITAGGAVGTFSVLSYSGGLSNLAATLSLSVIVLKSQSALSANLDTQGIYFKKILSVYDGSFTSTPNQYTRKFDLMTDNDAFNNRALDFGAQKRVACLLVGATLKFSVGSLANALATVSMDYRGKPAIYSDATAGNMVDFPPEEMGYLTAKITLAYATEAGKPIPADAQQIVAEVEEKFKTDAAEMSKSAAEKQ